MKSPSIDQKSFRASASSFASSIGWDFSEFTWRSSLRSSLLTGWSRHRVASRTPWSLPDDFAVPSAIWNLKKLTPLWRQYFFYIDSSRWRVHAFQFLHVCDQNISFPNSPPRTMHIWRILQVKLSYQIDGALTGLLKKSDDIQPLRQTERPGL